MNAGSIIPAAVGSITFVLMAVVGTDLRLDDFRRLLHRSRVVWVGLLVPPLILPLLAVALIELMRPPPGTAAGLLLISACPVGGISNAFTYLARGTTTLSVLLTALSCLAAAVTMPAVGAVLRLVGHPASIEAPPGPLLLAHLLLAVALPVSLGAFARTRWQATTERLRPVAWRLAFVLLGLLILLIVLNDVPAFVKALPHAVPLAVCFIVSSLAIGLGVARGSGATQPDGIALGIEFATRNVAVATTVAVTAMGRIDFAIFPTTYFLTEVPLLVAGALALRAVAPRRTSQATARAHTVH